MGGKQKLTSANLEWREGAPLSPVFGDVYFSGDGLAETTHVFLGGNALPARFDKGGVFSIGELGFGSGLNFLAAWDAWRDAAKPENARFEFFSVEAFPFAKADLEKAHKSWPAFAALSQELIAAYPPLQPGFHRMTFDDGAALTLYFGDALEGFSRAEANIDAWFLDGFAPSKNPAMWRPELLKELARLSAPGCTFATFTVAGAVRRALQEAGFAIEKRPGFGRKREMLAGALETHPAQKSQRTPWFNTRSKPALPGARVAIIGGGVAGASLAHALRNTGYNAMVFDGNGAASGASGNPAGLIMPRLDADESPVARFHVSAYVHTVRLLHKLQSENCETIFNPCGVLKKAADENEQRRHKKLFELAPLPEGWLTLQEDGALFLPQGGVVDPPAFVRALIGETRFVEKNVAAISFDKNGWRLTLDDGATEIFDAVVIANARDALRFTQMRSTPLAGSAGQVDYYPNTPALDHVVASGPYAAPAPPFQHNGGGVVIGATFDPIEPGATPSATPANAQRNIGNIQNILPELAATLSPQESVSRASVRCVTPDKSPIVGPVPDWGFYSGAYDGLRYGRKRDYPPGRVLPGLFVLTGLGSRGLVTAPLGGGDDRCRNRRRAFPG